MKQFLRALPRKFASWVLAILTTAILGVIFQTQNVIARLGNIGGDIGIADRLSMTAYDVTHLGTLYAPFIAIAFFIAFLAGGLVYRFAKAGRPLIYAVAGGVAILVMLFAMKGQFFDIHIIAGARDAFGIGFQMLAGALGGLVFAKTSHRSIKAKST